MASGKNEAGDEAAQVLSLFRGGKSKSEIGRQIGKDKKAVERILASAIRNCGKVAHVAR